MNQIQEDIDLLPYNTFRVSAKAKKFLVLHELEELQTKEPMLVLGEGANILFTRDFDGLVVKNELVGKKVVAEDNDSVILEVASGENWIDLVNWTVENGWSGIENLAFIPGTVGAAAVGDIAAYGQNFEDVLVSAMAANFDSRKEEKFSKNDFAFGYRESVFSHKLRNKYLLTSVTVKLSKAPRFDLAYHELHPRTKYASLQQMLDKIAKPPYTPKIVSQAVTALRLDRLPDWRQIGTAGSFFKNPIVKKEKAVELQKEIVDLQIYPAEKLIYSGDETKLLSNEELVKVPAARLLHELGWKGKRIGNVGTWEKHALAVVNYGGATGQEILDFTQQMQADIKSHFDIDLEPEVNII